MASAQFHHFGVPTNVKSDGETYIDGAKVYVTNPEAHPYRVEFLRFDADSPMPKDVCSQPHAAFIVPSLDKALEGQNVIIPPFDATDKLRCAFIKDGAAIIELMENR
ncbi:MAG: hypothetical protein K1Y02_20020 [Candidatus Hydrogenedentes bacterium]|nr:hypothetical protein [Candidatus Hydrogenedentota bacterium]